jgi:hypothetical protein
MMRLPIAFAAAVAICVAGVATIAQDNSQHEGGQPLPPEPLIGGIHWARDHAPARPHGGSPNLIYHDGPVMTTGAYVEPIFWGTRWNDSTFVADKIGGLQLFYNTIGGSPYEATNTEYTDGSATHVGTTVNLGPSHIDLSTAPRSGSHSSPILDEVCRTASSLVSNGYYPVYVDSPRGHAGYCAWHSVGTCPANGVTVQFAFFFNLDGDPGCDPEDPATAHSQGLEAEANVSGHELSEALTDPHLDAWYDSTGQENSDKCAWSFGPSDLKFTNQSQWKIQGNWSNAAFTAGTGFLNRDGQKGCIDGK